MVGLPTESLGRVIQRTTTDSRLQGHSGRKALARPCDHQEAWRVPVLFALLAAFSNALNVVVQHVASIGDPRHSKGWRFVRYLISNPLWLLGWVALAGAFVLQAIAQAPVT